MKSLIPILICASLIFLTSCGGSEPEPEVITSEIDGKWTMIGYSSQLYYTRDDYNPNDVIWTIYNQKLAIEINIDFYSTNIPLINAGTYDIEFNKNYFILHNDTLIFQLEDDVLEIVEYSGPGHYSTRDFERIIE